jgi:transposase
VLTNHRWVALYRGPVDDPAVHIHLQLTFVRIGLEAGPLSAWLYAGLVEVGLPAICVETRHMHAALSAQINKTDRNDALGIAQMMRVGLFKPSMSRRPPASSVGCS